MRKAGILPAGLGCLLMICCCTCQAQTPDRPVQSQYGHVQVTFPAGWEVAYFRPGTDTLSGKCAEKYGYFLVIAEAKADFANAKTIEDYAATILKIEAKNAKVKIRSVSEAKKLTFHGYPAVQYEMTATVGNLNLVYVKTFVDQPTRFSQVMCWTTPSHLEECRGDFAAVTESIEEPAGNVASHP